MAGLTLSNPAGVHPPLGRYSHAVLVAAGARRVVLSGQVAVRPDGSVADSAADQVAMVLANIGTVLAAHGLGPDNVVKMTASLNDRTVLADWRAQRDAFFGGHAPASTLLFVAGLADPRFLIEVEVEAAD
jgi:2-iminobutanoate/2-iminopropanoate deaminase